jgi:transmembrane sensor
MEEFKTNEEFIYSLIIDELDQQISPENKRVLDNWRALNPANENTYQEFVKIQQHIDKLYERQAYTPEDSWDALDQKLGRIAAVKPIFSKDLRTWLSVAASLLLIFSIGYYFIDHTKYIIVANGQNAAVKSVFLPDGTQVSLNAGASVRYIGRDFNTDRKLELLEGEVFVQVKHDNKFPFIMDLGELQARDIGTSFNIIKDQRHIILTVEEGKVAIKKMSAVQSILLTAGTTGRYSSLTGELIAEKSRDVNYKAWNDKDFVFVETPLKEVTRQLSKVYRTSISISGNDLKRKKLTAHLHYQTPDSALNVVAATLQCKLKSLKGGYILSDD